MVFPQASFSFLAFHSSSNTSAFNLRPPLKVWVTLVCAPRLCSGALSRTHKYPFTQWKENAWSAGAPLLPSRGCKLGKWQLLEPDLVTRSHVPLGAVLMSQRRSDQLQMLAAAGWGDVFFVMRDGWGCFPSGFKYPEKVFFLFLSNHRGLVFTKSHLFGPNSQM